ncbi:doxx family protein [uncultured Aquimarina sp.]|uniref:doxx family protein n=1 Tax=uncultured Aquimarina sp. TaxID=575652 RepID=UPI0026055B0C|nr:doxx family protein [uncultured Aquimarina sp.]
MYIIKRIVQNNILAISIGIVYLWFGVLKFFPHISPAEDLAIDTIHQLTFGLISSKISIIMLAIMEVTIGILLLTNAFRRNVIILALIHMAFTFTPLFLFLEKSFSNTPFVPTLLGQYIAKNIIIVGALVTLLNEKKKIKI